MAAEGPAQVERNVLADTAGPLWGCGGIGGERTEGDNILHFLECGFVKVRQQGLFLHDPDGESDGQKVRYWSVKHRLYGVNVADHEHRWRH